VADAPPNNLSRPPRTTDQNSSRTVALRRSPAAERATEVFLRRQGPLLAVFREWIVAHGHEFGS
jgi:hypothetical protein